MKELITYFGKLYERRDLIRFLAVSNLKSSNKNTILGYLWWLLEPLLLMGVYVIIVSVIFDRGGPDYPVFILIALLTWRAFYTSVNTSTVVMVSSESIIKQVLFPKAVLPLAAIISQHVYFLFGLAILFVMILIFNIDFTLKMFLFPVIFIIQIFFTMGVAFLFSSVNLFYRDVQNLITHLFRAWWYLSPGLYSIDLIPEQFQTVYKFINPFAVFFTSYRDVLMFGRVPDITMLFWVSFISVVVFALGFYIFIKSERSFVKVL